MSSPQSPGETTLARLREPSSPALRRLALLVTDDVLATPARDLVPADALARHLAAAVTAAAAAPDAADALRTRLTAARARLRAETRSARTWVLPPIEAPVRKVLAQPWSPSESLALRVSDHPAVRALLKDVLSGALARFGRGLKALDGGVLGGLGGKVARRGAGLLGGLGDLAGGLVGAVKDEFEAAVEGRVRDTVGQATDEAVRAIAVWAAHPAHAGSLAALRVSLLDVVLDTPVGQLVGELDEVPTDTLVDAVLEGLRDAAARPTLVADLSAVVVEGLSWLQDDTLGDLVDAFGVRAPVQDAVVELAMPRLQALVQTEAFAAWWRELHD